VELIVEELLVNIISYGGGDEEHWIRFSILSTIETVHMTIEDDAPLFNPIAHSTLALEAGIDDREPGGLGLVLVKNMVDDMTDERRDNKNILTLKKIGSLYRPGQLRRVA
jgi:serine/threonine-protein kinase RsbW/sigma-B regulation protein RsbU (phosphoserine phosphatase)